MKESGNNIFLGGAIITAVVSSLCCILPVVAIMLGVGAFSIASFFETLRPYMLVVAISALAFGFYRTYLRREKCYEGQTCATKPIGRVNKIVLWAATVTVVGMALFPWYSGNITAALINPEIETQSDLSGDNIPAPERPAIVDSNVAAENEATQQNRKTVVIAVEGMTCESCAASINIALKRVKGVISAEASYRDKNVTVVYNPKQVTVERIKKGIYDAGYTPK